MPRHTDAGRWRRVRRIAAAGRWVTCYQLRRIGLVRRRQPRHRRSRNRFRTGTTAGGADEDVIIVVAIRLVQMLLLLLRRRLMMMASR